MPELPEVEVTRQGLLPHLLKRRITDVRWSSKRLRQPMPRKLLRDCIAGNRVQAIDRRAKYLLLRMEDNAVLVLHLGMTGRLGMFQRDTPQAPHDHLQLILDSGMEMRFNDARRFGSVVVWPKKESAALEKAFDRDKGIEPFGPDFTAANLARLAGRRRVAVKKILMDSRIIAGIGNIYANETLFAASIHPETRVDTLSLRQWQDLTTCCRTILDQAIRAGGSTISDFIGSSGRPGYFQLQLAVYGKKDLPCPLCGTKITKKDIGGRASFFCSSCQLL